LVALDQDGVGHPHAGQVIKGRASHHAPAAVLTASGAPARDPQGRPWRNPWALTAAGVAALLAFGALRIAATPIETSDHWVRIVQPNIPQREKWEPAALSDRASARNCAGAVPAP
ncbi:MAG: hypothetical protein AAGL49_14865, partial [Pseudomonadota bacterium]